MSFKEAASTSFDAKMSEVVVSKMPALGYIVLRRGNNADNMSNEPLECGHCTCVFHYNVAERLKTMLYRCPRGVIHHIDVVQCVWCEHLVCAHSIVSRAPVPDSDPDPSRADWSEASARKGSVVASDGTGIAIRVVDYTGQVEDANSHQRQPQRDLKRVRNSRQ